MIPWLRAPALLSSMGPSGRGQGPVPALPTGGRTFQALLRRAAPCPAPQFVEGFVGVGAAYQRVLSSSKFCLAPFG